MNQGLACGQVSHEDISLSFLKEEKHNYSSKTADTYQRSVYGTFRKHGDESNFKC